MEALFRPSRGSWARRLRMVGCPALIAAAASCSSNSSDQSKTTGIVDGSAGACNTLADDGPGVVPRAVASAAPNPMGGAITDGTYVLSGIVLYTGPGGSTTAPNGTFSAVTQISGGKMLQVGTVNGTETRYASTFTTSGTTISTNDTCPSPKSETHSFTASTTELRIYDSAAGGTLEQAFSKR